MALGKVYVTQKVIEQRRIDISDALRYGDVIELLPNDNNQMLNVGNVRAILRNKLKDFSDDDCLLPIGDPTAIMLAGIVAGSMNNGNVKVLKWDRDENRYYCIQL